jgi:tetratricopeptide (TPR) repeat protein
LNTNYFNTLPVFFLLLLFYFIGPDARLTAQNKKTDSLSVLLAKDKADTNKIDHLNALGWELMYQNPDSAISLGNQALELAEKLNNPKRIGGSSSNLGVYYWLKGEFPTSLAFQFKALKIRESIRDKKGIATSLGNIGIVYWNQANYLKALENLERALKIMEELQDKNGIAKNTANIGVIHFQLGNYSNAREHYFKALKIDEELGDKNRIANHLGNIGVVYNEEAKNENIPPARRDSFLQCTIEYYGKALAIEKELGNTTKIARHLGNIGEASIRLKKYEQAENYLLQAVRMSDSSGILNEKMQFEYSLSELYSLQNKHEKSLEHYLKYSIAKDSLFNRQKNDELTRTEMNYEFEKKEAEHNAEQERKTALAAIDSHRRSLVIYFSLGGFGLMLIALAFILRSLKITRQQKNIIQQQKHFVEEKQREILDSIHYAKRIQVALITSEKYIAKNLSRLMK